jgi:polar amino acid transport system permease protein
VEVLFEARWLILSGTIVTLRVFFFSFLLAAALALAFGILRQSRNALVRAAATVFVEFFRGVSTVVQLFWLYFALPFFGISLPAEVAAVLGLGLVHGAYGSEVVRGAMQAVAREQWEAATALSLSRFEAMRSIILPQAILVMLPPFGNALVLLLKGTSIASIITVPELTFQSHLVVTQTLAVVAVFGTVMLVYYLIAILITGGVRALERQLGRWRPVVAGNR